MMPLTAASVLHDIIQFWSHLILMLVLVLATIGLAGALIGTTMAVLCGRTGKSWWSWR